MPNINFLLMILLMACKIQSDDGSSTRSVQLSDLLDSKSEYYTKEDECLIEIDKTLKKDRVSNALAEELCLPRSKVSFLLPVPSSGTKDEIVAPHLKLAILFDSSRSLKDQDEKRERFDAFKQYLMAIFDKKGEISSAEIRVYPFRYCNKGEHKLRLTKNMSKKEFEQKVDKLIGTKDLGNIGKSIVDEEQLTNLRAYGATGSTNYLHSFATAKKFLEQEKDEKIEVELKQMLIFSDGLPFTFNDNNTETIKDSCNKSSFASWKLTDWRDKLFAGENHNDIDEALDNCLYDVFHPQTDCKRPTTEDEGLTMPQAWSDPLNHALGMIQHSRVINKEKDNFKIYSVHLNNCKTNNTKSTKFDENFLCRQISENFFKSFSDGFVAVDRATDLRDKLEKQTLEKQLDHKYSEGTVTINRGKTVVDDKPVISNKGKGKPSLVKVTGRKKASKKSNDWESFDYKDNKDNTLTASLKVKADKHNYRVKYNFRFDKDNCLDHGDKARKRVTGRGDVEAIEVHSYHQKDNYRAWCVLPVINRAFEFPDEQETPPEKEVTCADSPPEKQTCPGKGGLVWIASNSGSTPTECCGQLTKNPTSGEGEIPQENPDQNRVVKDNNKNKIDTSDQQPVSPPPAVQSAIVEVKILDW